MFWRICRFSTLVFHSVDGGKERTKRSELRFVCMTIPVLRRMRRRLTVSEFDVDGSIAYSLHADQQYLLCIDLHRINRVWKC